VAAWSDGGDRAVIHSRTRCSQTGPSPRAPWVLLSNGMIPGIGVLTQDTLWCFSQVKGTIEIGATEGSDHGAVPPAPLPPSPVRLAAGRDHGYLSAGFWFPRK